MQALYLRWRPMAFEEVVGQDHVTGTLRNALASGRIGHAYLFSGPRGTGKTTMARLLAKAVNCEDPDPYRRPCNACSHCVAVNEGRFLDLIEIDAASHTSVDDVRELRDRIAFAPNEGTYKVYIIDEVHRFSGAAFDALLKTIEEPPPHAIFVLATTEIHKVPQTILSRCQRFDFRRIPLQQLAARLSEIAQQEGIQVEPEALELVARHGGGSLRDSISLLDQLIVDTSQTVTLGFVQAGLGAVANEAIQYLTWYIAHGDSANGLNLINQVLDEGADARQFARQVVEYLRLVTLIQAGGTDITHGAASSDILDLAGQQATALSRRALLAAIRNFNDAATDTRSGWQPQIPLEIAFLESIEAVHQSSAVPVAPLAPVPQAASVSVESPAQNTRPAAETPPAETAESLALTAPAISPEVLIARWKLVEQTLREADKPAEAAIRSKRSVTIEGSTVVLQATSDIIKAKIEANRAVIEEVLSHVYGVPLTLRCGVNTGQASDTSARSEDLISKDSVIAFTVNLGGRITDVDTHEEQ